MRWNERRNGLAWKPGLAVILLMVGCVSGTARTHAESPQRSVQLIETNGHLYFASSLQPGRTAVTVGDEQGLRLTGFIQVQPGDDHTRVRIFRLRGISPRHENEHGVSFAPQVPGEFAIELRPTANVDHYSLQLRVATVLSGQPCLEEAKLLRTCCGYSLSATREGQALPIGRGEKLDDVIRQQAETYRQFLRIAEYCCRPGFEFVPKHQVAPDHMAFVLPQGWPIVGVPGLLVLGAGAIPGPLLDLP